MVTIGIRDLKSQLSRHLGAVKKGASILITQHGKPVARIIPEPQRKKTIAEQLAPLVASGSITLPTKPRNQAVYPSIRLKGKPLSEMIIEDRR